MKKKLSLLMVAFMAVAAFAGLNSWRAAGDPSYTITFQTTGTEKDASQAISTVEDIIADGATYVSEISNAVKVYKGRDGRGIKLGTTSANGEITLKLANAVKPSKIVVKARKYNDTSNAITINGQEFEINDGTSDDCVLNYDGNTEVSEIAIVANKFRAYVISIAVYEASSEAPAEDVYVVAGGSTTLFGTAWNPSAEDNDANKMTKNTETGVYEKVYAGVALPAGNIEFKIVKNGSDWIPSGDNLICTISETATYDVTFTFDPATSAITSNAEKKGEAQLPDAEINKVVFLGDFNEWNQQDEMTKGEGNVWTKEVDATAFTDDLQFKLVVNGSEWIGNGSSMIIDAPEGWVDGQNEGYYNYILKNATTGYQTYTVTASWAANTNAAEGWTLKIEGKDAREAAPIVIPDGAIVFDFKSAGQAGETLTKNSANFQVNMGEGKEDRTDRNFKSYKDYAGTILPATCQVAIGEEPKVDENGLIVSYDRYLSVYGLNTGDKVRIIYSGVPDGKTPTYCPGTSVDTKAAINGSELVSTVSPIGSGDVIEITEAGEKNYVIMSVFTGMRIEMVIIEPVPAVAEINKVEIRGGKQGDWASFSKNFELVKAEEGAAYTATIDLAEFAGPFEFKLVVNDGANWIGTNMLTLVDEAELVQGSETDGANFTLKNDAYQTYTVTASWAANTNAAEGWTLKIEGKDAREAAPIVIPDGAIVFDFKSAGQAGETLTKNSANFQVNMGEGKEDRTDRNFKSYKDYAGTILPATCQVAIGEEPKVDENGLIVSYDRYLSVYGLNTGDKVRIIYSGVPDGKTPTYCPGTSVDTKAAINGSELVSTVSPIGSGDVIEITEAGEKNYVIMSVFTGMRIEMVIIEPVAEDTYTVAGAFYNSDEPQALFLETVWDPTNVKNDLEKYTDTYYFKSYAGVEFPSAGNFQVKVVKNHDWNVASYPAGNVTVAITEAGKYDVSISFDTETSEVRVNVDPQFVPAEPIYTVVGAFYTAESEIDIFNGAKPWDEANTNADMIIVDGDDFYSLQINAQGIELQPGTITYKVVKNHDWTENWGMAVTEDNPNGNAEYKINEAGKYNILFKFNPNAKFENGYNVDCVVTTTTGIQNVKADDLKNATIYNLQGVRMQNVQKGLYIVNGKKVVVK